MKIKFLIPSISDNSNVRSSSFLVKSDAKSRLVGSIRKHRLNNFGEYVIKIPMPSIGSSRHVSDDPLLVEFSNVVKRTFFTTNWTSDNDEFITYVSFRYDDGDSSILLRKDSSRYHMNGVHKNMKDIISALSKIIMFGANNRSAVAMNNYIDRCINYPENVMYALENRMPYYFYEMGQKISVRINLTAISEKEVALELCDGIWGSINIKDVNTLIDSYRYGKTRSTKWANISPKKLWTNIMKSEPSDSELTLMTAWLKQNRTSKMVETRAKELLVELDDSHKELFLIRNKKWLSKYFSKITISKNYDFSMLVRGKLGDWIVYPSSPDSRHQSVKVVFVIGREGNAYGGGFEYLGPFCIDNLHGNSSIGDQIAARAMILKNDVVAKSMIHTLARVDSTTYRLSDSDVFNLTHTEESMPVKKWLEDIYHTGAVYK